VSFWPNFLQEKAGKQDMGKTFTKIAGEPKSEYQNQASIVRWRGGRHAGLLKEIQTGRRLIGIYRE
jgi:hypothetical protein